MNNFKKWVVVLISLFLMQQEASAQSFRPQPSGLCTLPQGSTRTVDIWDGKGVRPYGWRTQTRSGLVVCFDLYVEGQLIGQHRVDFGAHRSRTRILDANAASRIFVTLSLLNGERGVGSVAEYLNSFPTQIPPEANKGYFLYSGPRD